MGSLFAFGAAHSVVERSSTRSEDVRLLLAHVEWCVAAPLTLLCFVAALPARYQQLRAEEVSARGLVSGRHPLALPPLLRDWLSGPLYAPTILALEIMVMLVAATAALILVWRGRRERIAVVASFALLCYSALFLSPLDALMREHPTWTLAVRLVQAIGLESSLLLFYISPDGHFVPRWTRPMAMLWTLWTLAGLLMPASLFNLANGRLHVATPSIFPLPWLLVNMAWWSTGVLAQIVRYRHVSTPQQRQQTKWILIGWIAVIALYGTLAIPRLTFPDFSGSVTCDLLYRGVATPIFEATLTLAPVTITISMLRYRLWDADIVINRALVYGLVTVAVGLVYGVLILGFQALFRSVTSQESSLAVALSTLASALLFQPAHRHIQRIVDRRFYRRKFDTARLVTEFGRGVRDEVELSALLDKLNAVVQQSMQPEYVSAVLLPPPAERHRAQRSGAGQPDESRRERILGAR